MKLPASLTMKRLACFSCCSIKNSGEVSLRWAHPLFGLNYKTRHEQIIELWRNKALQLPSAFRKRLFSVTPCTYDTAAIRSPCRALCQSMLYSETVSAFTSEAENTRNSRWRALKAWLEVFFSPPTWNPPPSTYRTYTVTFSFSPLLHHWSSTSPRFVPLTIAVQWSEGMEPAKHQRERWPGEREHKSLFLFSQHIVQFRGFDGLCAPADLFLNDTVVCVTGCWSIENQGNWWHFGIWAGLGTNFGSWMAQTERLP